MTEIRSMTRHEAEGLLSYLQGVPEERWDAPTVCAPWTVRHLVAHLTALNLQTMGRFARHMIRHRFNFDKVVNADIEALLGTRDEMLAAFEASVATPTTPKALAEIALGEFVVHGEDIRRALGERGGQRDHPSAHIEVVGPNCAAAGKPLHGRKRAAGLSFRATDGDFRWGDGPEVAGPGIDLVLAISGRSAALDTCTGAGVDTLRSLLASDSCRSASP